MQATQEKRISFEDKIIYEVGKTTAVVNCVFRQSESETVTTILSRLIHADIENT